VVRPLYKEGVVMVDLALRSLLIHKCTIIEAGVTDAGYGHGSAPDWANPVNTYSNIPFRLMPRDGDVRFRIELQGKTAGTLIAYWLGFLSYDDAPSGLLEKNASLKFRVQDVVDSNGSVVDTGPFDIKGINLSSGLKHHIELTLKRVS